LSVAKDPGRILKILSVLVINTKKWILQSILSLWMTYIVKKHKKLGALVHNQNRMKLVSILICTYNAEKTIKETLTSCLNQTYSSFEILIHDDQSKDKTLEVIASLGDQRIKVLKSWKKLWPYGGLNFLLDHAKGEYIAIQDHDDLRKPEKLEKQVNFLEENSKYVGCGTKTLMRYEGDNKGFEYYLWKENYYTIHPSLLFRNEWYRYPKRIYMNDAYFQKKVLCKWKNLIRNLDETLTIHRIKPWAENYSYKRFKLTRENLNTIFYLHPVLYGIGVVGFEILRKLMYPILHRIKKDWWIDKIERWPFRLEGYKMWEVMKK